MTMSNSEARKRNLERDAAEAEYLTPEDIAWVKRVRAQEEAIRDINRRFFETFGYDGRGSE